MAPLPQIVSPAQWLEAHEALLAKEKQTTRALDALAGDRRRLPMVEIECDYVLAGPDGDGSLIDRGESFGLSVFVRDRQRIFRTYFTSGRGVESLGPVWSFLDLTPFGRQEKWEDTPEGRPQTPRYEWWRRHDEYDGYDEAEHVATASAEVNR